MSLNLKELLKNPDQHLTGEITQFSSVQKMINNPLVKKIVKIVYDLKMNFFHETLTLKIQGEIMFEIEALDANSGQEFLYHQQINWNDDYRFDQNFQSNANFVIGTEFDLVTYLVEQINLNIPINLSMNHDIISKVGSGWELLSESNDQLSKKQNNSPDPRWEKLDQWKNK